MDIVQFILDLIFQPGSSLWLVPAINVTVLLLIGMLLVTGFYTDVAKIHIIVMSSLAVGLLLSVNWFFHEYNKAVKEGAGKDSVETIRQAEPIENKKSD
eukprot:gene28126-33963_t